MGTIAEFRRGIYERPTRELAYAVVFYFFIHIFLQSIEESCVEWVRDEIAHFFGITRPSFMSVVTFIWNWVVPVLGTALLLFAYHRANLRQVHSHAASGETLERPFERDSFLPWFMVMSAIALFVIFERQGPPINGTVLLADSPAMEGSPLAISWEGGEIRSSSTPPQINSLTFLAKNISSDEIILKDAYIISAVDSAKIHMTVSTPPGPSFRIEDILPIPPDAWINFIITFDAGLSEAVFLNKWGRFRAVVEYDDKNVRRNFNAIWVMQRMAALHPEAAPHVSKRQQ
jgi:hypothetical protein